jgi:hypothetical protein
MLHQEKICNPDLEAGSANKNFSLLEPAKCAMTKSPISMVGSARSSQDRFLMSDGAMQKLELT